ncbi:MAG: ribonuclease Z [Candidatus Thermoplasmatota archaeon]|nr:ribonuclease Z [Candidatus Thermoplasmatota archaeon]MCL5930689.1 ribonuclease Z [Candidatus Thermoplasmatota archaeon]
MISSIRLYFLGTGGSWPTPQRNTLSIGIRVDDEGLLFDCGEGTQTSLMKSSLSLMKIRRIFITHFHGDHFLGLPGLIQTMSFYGRTEPLEIYGPIGASSVLGNLLSIGYYSLNFEIRIEELKGSGSVNFGDYSISYAKANHTIPALSYSLTEREYPKLEESKIKEMGVPRHLLEKIRREGSVQVNGRTISLEDISAGIRKGRKVSYSGDTRRDQSLLELFRNSTVLIHESTGEKSNENKVISYGHSTGNDAGIQARDSNSRKLILIHFSPRYNDIKPILEEARSVFQNVTAAEELMEMEVGIND